MSFAGNAPQTDFVTQENGGLKGILGRIGLSEGPVHV